MLVARDLAQAQLDSLLGRCSPVLKLAIALVWLVGLATTTAFGPPVALTALTVTAALTIGRVPVGDLVRGLGPLLVAAAGLAFFNTVFGAANADPAATTLVTIGPFRITEPAAAAGIALGLRVVAIAAVGATFALTTDSTHLADSLVQQAHVPERFAYGALAAYGVIPRLGENLATLRAARRMRGLLGGWHPRLLVGLLVLAIRHGDRMALAMDARAFGSGPRTAYRIVAWSWLDAVVAGAAVVALVIALVVAG